MMHHRRHSPSPSSGGSSIVDGGSIHSPCSSSSSSSIRSSSSSPCRRHRTMTSSSLSSVDEPLMVDVEAPATLSEGFEFWASITGGGSSNNNKNDKKRPLSSLFLVRVPPGGVKSGQTLRVPLLMDEERHYLDAAYAGENVDCEHCDNYTTIIQKQKQWRQQQSGQWKDGICSCFRHGLWHPHLWNAWLCPQVLLGQLLVRMKLTRLVHQNPLTMVDNNDSVEHNDCDTLSPSSPNNSSSSSSTLSVQSAFRKIMCLVVLLSLYDALVAPPLFDVQVDEETGEIAFARGSAGGFPVWHQILYIVLSLPMTIWGILVVVKLRATIRHRHRIPTGRLGRCEDLVCVCCCSCCVMSQMARQTADYDGDEPASCCSPNGIRAGNTKGHGGDKQDDDEFEEEHHPSFSPAPLSLSSSLDSSFSSDSTVSFSSSGAGSSSTNCTRRGETNNRPLIVATVV